MNTGKDFGSDSVMDSGGNSSMDSGIPGPDAPLQKLW